MTRLTILLLGVMLVGCDMVNAPQQADQIGDAYASALETTGMARYGCTYWVEPPTAVEEVDSLAFCPYSDSGSYYPILVRSHWISTNSECSITEPGDVVGGNAGILRYFGCYRKPIAHPVPVVTECADCGWPK
jgi:hypothetical protein